MNESVRMDLVDIEDHTEYRDQKCEKLEKMLTKDPNFEGCVVKRLRLQKEAPELKDPFDIQDPDGTHVVWFYDWEMQILDEPEVLSYLEVQIRREHQLDSHLFWDMVSFVVLFIGMTAVTIDAMFIIISGVTQFSLSLLPITLAVLLSGILMFSSNLRRKRNSERRLDIDSARKDSVFLEALRKLAKLSGTGNKELDQYVERLEAVEKALSID